MTSSVRALVPTDPSARRLAAAQLANSIGDGAFYVTSALFFSRVVGLSATQIGLGLTIGWAAGFLASVPLGALADRWGPRGTAVVLAVLTALGVTGFLVVRSPLGFVVVCCVYGSAQTGLGAVRQALLAALVPAADRTTVRAALQAILNGGLAVGAALGGVALAVDRPAAYLTVLGLDALSFLVAALVLTRLPAVAGVRAASGEPRLAVLRDRPYALVSLINAVMLFYMPLLSLVLPLWIVQRTAAPGWTASALLLLNTTTVLWLQVPVGRRVRSLADAGRSVRAAGIAMLAACLVFAASLLTASPALSIVVLLAGAGLLVLGEMLLAAGAWKLSFDLAPEDRQGQYQGFFGTGTAVARMAGPVVLTTVVLGWGAPGWLALGVVLVAAGTAMGPAARWAERTRVAPAPTDEPAPVACSA